jgi:hypothetical protein
VRAALAAGATDGRLHLLLGHALWRNGQVDEAVRELRLAGDLLADPALQADTALALAEAHLAAHDLPSARAAAAKYLALEKRPKHESDLARARLIAR